MRFTLRQLQVFLATAELENISQAAESLSMSQSAASAALKDLEQRYSIQLFDRVGKRLKLNDQGRALRPAASAVLDQAQSFEHALLGDETAAKLAIGATLTIGNYLAVDLMASHMHTYPNADLTLHVANTEHISRGLLNFELDVGLLEGEVQHRDLEIIRWRQDELLIFCAPENPLASKRRLSDSDLLAANWILREQGSGTRQAFDRAMQGLLPELRVYMELEHTEAIKRAVEANLGIGCLSAITLAPALKRGDIVALNAPQRDMQRWFYFALHKRRQQTPAIKKWIESCQLPLVGK